LPAGFVVGCAVRDRRLTGDAGGLLGVVELSGGVSEPGPPPMFAGISVAAPVVVVTAKPLTRRTDATTAAAIPRIAVFDLNILPTSLYCGPLFRPPGDAPDAGEP
jgi:hypothetical protein